MKKKYVLFIPGIMLAILLISSCKKDTTPYNPLISGNTNLLKTTLQILKSPQQTDSVITTNTYDSQNRLISTIQIITNQPQYNDTSIYSYYSDSVLMYLTGNGYTTYYLNAQGYRASDNKGNRWTYNSNGYLVSSIPSANSGLGTTNYTYNSINQLTNETTVSNSGTITYTYSYPTNSYTNPSSNWQTGKTTGAQWTKEVRTGYGSIVTFNLVYSIDSRNRISTEILTNESNGLPINIYFAYY